MPVREQLFSHTVGHLDYGSTSQELDQKLAEAVQAVVDTNKKATLTLTLKISPKNDGAQVFILPEIKANIPKHQPAETLFFPADGNLLRNDPKQQSIPGMRIIEDTAPPTSYKQA